MDRKYLLQDIVEALSTAENLKKKDAEDFLRTYFSIIEEGLLRDKIVRINDLGTLKLIEAEARNSVDVNTGQSFLIKEHFKLSYVPDQTLKDQINKPFAGFEPVETEEISIPKVSKLQIEPEITESSKTNESYELSENSVISDILSDSPELIHKDVKSKSESGDKKDWKLLFWILLIIIVAGAVFWTVKSNIDARKDLEEKNEIFDEFLDDSSQKAVKSDTISEFEKDTLVAQKDTILQTKVLEEKTEYPLYITIHPGERLMTLAEKYYGHKSFWVYIYLDNKDVINNPDDITVGTRVRISRPDSSKMNPDDPECIKKAGALQYQILSESN